MTTKQNELRTFIVPSTGKQIFVKRETSIAMLILDLSSDPTNPKPLPPIQEVKVAGRVMAERNYSDPHHIEAVAAWEQGIEAKASMIVLDDVHVELSDADKADVKQLREERSHLPLNQSDQKVWLKYIAIKSDDDFKALLQFIRGVSEPTEEGIADAADGFQGKTKR